MSVPSKTVPVVLPEWIWGRLATIAANQKISTGEVIADAIMAVLQENPPVRKTRVSHLPGNSRLDALAAELSAARKAGYRVPGKRSRRTPLQLAELNVQIAALHAEGLTDVQISKRLGISDASAQRYRTLLGLRTIGKPERPAKPKEFAA